MKRIIIHLIRGFCFVVLPLGSFYVSGRFLFGSVRASFSDVIMPIVLFVFPTAIIFSTQPIGKLELAAPQSDQGLATHQDSSVTRGPHPYPRGSKWAMHFTLVVLVPVLVLAFVAIVIGGLLALLRQQPPGSFWNVITVLLAMFALPIGIMRLSVPIERSFATVAPSSSSGVAWIKHYWPSVKLVISLAFIGLIPTLLFVLIGILMTGG